LIAQTTQSETGTDDERAPPRPPNAVVANKKRRRSMKATSLRELAHKDDQDAMDGSNGSAAAALKEQAAARARSLEASSTTAVDAGLASTKTGKAGAKAPPAAPPASVERKNQAKAVPSTSTKRKSQDATPASAKKDKGKGPMVDPNELAVVALTLAVRREVSARTLALLGNPEDADDVYLCNDDSRAMYIACIMAVAPASIERAEVLARETAVVNARLRPADAENKMTTARTTDILGQCALARSAAHHGLSTWIWGMWTSLVVYDTTEVDNDGSDSDEHTPAIGLWWLKGRRFLNTKRGRIALYNVFASFIDRYDVTDALKDDYHKGRRVLRLTPAVIALILAKVRNVRLCCHESVVSI